MPFFLLHSCWGVRQDVFALTQQNVRVSVHPRPLRQVIEMNPSWRLCTLVFSTNHLPSDRPGGKGRSSYIFPSAVDTGNNTVLCFSTVNDHIALLQVTLPC